MSARVAVDRDTPDETLRSVVADWVEAHVPEPWRVAAPDGHDAIRAVRSRDEYEAWYPTFADSGLAVDSIGVELVDISVLFDTDTVHATFVCDK